MTVGLIEPASGPLTGRCRVPGDKAISHRAAILAALATGVSAISGFSSAGDCQATLAAVAALGADVRHLGGTVQVHGRGGGAPVDSTLRVVDCRRSGTTMRLLSGVAASWEGATLLTGDPQLLRRPMERVAAPLRQMGAVVETGPEGRPPLRFTGGPLSGITFTSPVASAQVKSAVLLAGLCASGETVVHEPIPTRDHTERLLVAMGARLSVVHSDDGTRISVSRSTLRPLHLTIPGDASSAAVIMAAAALVPGSDVVIEGVSGNPTRLGLLQVLLRMGGRVDVVPVAGIGSPEPTVTLRVRQAPLRATSVSADEVPLLVDELPLVGLLATQADGTTEVRGAAELRVKESDRIRGLVDGLRALGGEVEELPDGFVVEGPRRLSPGRCDSLTDHRLAMTFALAGLVAAGPVEVNGLEFVEDSFPGFLECLDRLR
ncbi:MAG TPA: 3-phosphoshikimate 1-carboxyvinyltransferase [Candidatus Nanopelagicaceae bacterium]|nr:3-phosphoshikimate 1-carboxyvinyltransferase [Candidatus Nanopelagicaceae bacterium]